MRKVLRLFGQQFVQGPFYIGRILFKTRLPINGGLYSYKGRDESWHGAFYLHPLNQDAQERVLTVNVGMESDVRTNNGYGKCTRTQKNLKLMTK